MDHACVKTAAAVVNNEKSLLSLYRKFRNSVTHAIITVEL